VHAANAKLAEGTTKKKTRDSIFFNFLQNVYPGR